jgi:hypothetical protein
VEEAAGAVGDAEVHEFLEIRILKACSPIARARVATLLGAPYTQTQMSYDLRWRRLNGMIRRLERSNTYTFTPDGLRVAVFYVKVHDRLLRSLIAANSPPAPLTLRQALRTLDRHVEDYIAEARMAA